MKRKHICTACNGTGWYDACDKKGNPIKCGACGGTGLEQFKSKELIQELYEIIKIFVENDCLKEEFEVASEQDDIKTIDDLVAYFEDELRCWNDN
jgi:hypothetical protein